MYWKEINLMDNIINPLNTWASLLYPPNTSTYKISVLIDKQICQ